MNGKGREWGQSDQSLLFAISVSFIKVTPCRKSLCLFNQDALDSWFGSCDIKLQSCQNK
jgi:hypothetical protein